MTGTSQSITTGCPSKWSFDRSGRRLAIVVGSECWTNLDSVVPHGAGWIDLESGAVTLLDPLPLGTDGACDFISEAFFDTQDRLWLNAKSGQFVFESGSTSPKRPELFVCGPKQGRNRFVEPRSVLNSERAISGCGLPNPSGTLGTAGLRSVYETLSTGLTDIYLLNLADPAQVAAEPFGGVAVALSGDVPDAGCHTDLATWLDDDTLLCAGSYGLPDLRILDVSPTGATFSAPLVARTQDAQERCRYPTTQIFHVDANIAYVRMPNEACEDSIHRVDLTARTSVDLGPTPTVFTGNLSQAMRGDAATRVPNG